MGFAQLMKDLATGAVETIKIVLPGTAEALVEFGDKLMMSGSGETAVVTPIFGFLTLGLCCTFGAWVVKRIARKVT